MKNKALIIGILVLATAGVAYFVFRKPKEEIIDKSAEAEKTGRKRDGSKPSIKPTGSAAKVTEGASPESVCNATLEFWKKYEGKYVRSIDNIVYFIERGIAYPWQSKTSDSNTAWNNSTFMSMTEFEKFLKWNKINPNADKLTPCRKLITW